MDSSVNATAGKMKAAFSGAIGVGAVAAFSKSIVDLSGDIKDTSLALNINTDKLQGQQSAFGQSGVNSEKYRAAMVKLLEAQESVIGGDEKMIKAFEALGLSFRDIADSTPDELILKMADGFKNAESHGKAFAATMDILGKGGSRMAAALRGGRDEIEEMAAAARKLSPEAVDVLEKSGDDATEAWRGTKVVVGETFSRIIEGWKAIGIFRNRVLGGGEIERTDGFVEPPKPPPLPPITPEKKEDPREIRARIEAKKEEMKQENDMLRMQQNRARSAQAAIDVFNNSTPDQRRQTIRDQRRADRAAAREMRMEEAGEKVRDARSGIGKLRQEAERAAKHINMSEETIDKLAKAIAAETDKLIVKP